MKCMLCDNKKIELFIRTHAGNYLKCDNCGLIQWDNISDMSNIKAIYNDKYFTEKKRDGTGADFIGEERLYLARFRDRINRIERHVKSGGHILDIGASVGQFLFVAREHGWKASGIEISGTAAHMAKQRYGIDIQVGTIEDISFKKDFFDVVTLWHVFEHLPDPKKTLKSIHSILKEGGLLVIELPNIGSQEAIEAGTGWSYLRPCEHLYHYTLDTITMLLRNTGFKVETIEYESGGTGIGEMMDRIGIGRVKRFLIQMFPPAILFKKWIYSLMTAKGSKEIMIVFSTKKG